MKIITGPLNNESQNRELLWNFVRESLLFLWPAAACARETWHRYRKMKSMREGKIVSKSTVDSIKCDACGENAVVPYRVEPCQCTVCYWCAESRSASTKSSCASCENAVERKSFLWGTLMGIVESVR